MDDDVKFLSLLFSPYDSGYIEVRGLKSGGRGVQEWFPVGQPEAAAACARAYDMDGYNAYYGVLPRDTQSGKKAAVSRTAWLWADVDFKSGSQIRASLAMDETPPDILVHSGHGWHLYYQLKKPLDLSDPAAKKAFEARLKTFQKRFGSDAVQNVDRILRVPGTFNRKTLPMVRVRVLDWPQAVYADSQWRKEMRDPNYSRVQRLFHRLQHRSVIGVGTEGAFALFRERYLHAD